MENSKRIGRFTSSQMSRLCASLKNGTPSSAFRTYVEEVSLEREMQRTIKTRVKTQPMKWGNLMEVVLFNLLGLGYKMTHKMTIEHHKYPEDWSGTPDLIAEGVKIGEIKCYEPKKFMLLTRCLRKESVEAFKGDFPEEYWQCVSNAVLCGLKRAEIIVYMPYFSELKEIIEQVEDSNFLESNGLDPQDYYFLTRNDVESLPHLPDDSPVSNVNSFEFEVPIEDIQFLTKRVIEGKKLLDSYLN